MGNVLVVAEHVDNKLRNVTLPAITFARQAADLTGGEVVVLVLGQGARAVAEEVARYGADRVLLGEAEALSHYLAENWEPAVVKAAKEFNAEIVCAPSSTTGKDFLPRVAARLDAGMISDAIAVEQQDNTLQFKRPLWAGNVITSVEVTTPVKVVSVRTTDFDPPQADSPCPIEQIDVGAPGTDAGPVRELRPGQE